MCKQNNQEVMDIVSAFPQLQSFNVSGGHYSQMYVGGSLIIGILSK